MNQALHKQVYGHLALLITLSVLCVSSTAQVADLGKSYINVTKGANGGTVETNDILEIRASFVVRSGTFDSCAYFDAIPAGTTYIPNTIRVLTNEGKIYKQFTDGMNDDEGWKNGTAIRINLGYNQAASPANAFRRGRVANTHKPSFGGSCIMIASFRVTVTAATGSMISTGGGNMTFKNGSNPIQTFTYPANTLAVYPNYGICSNTIGVNALGTESNGTFGSGKPRNRGISGNVPPGYTYKLFDIGAPNDYSYGIPNNTSTLVNYTTSNSWAKPDGSSPTHRVFNVWDIIGDHTGAVSPILGNPAADTVNNSNGGYMLVINAAYKIDSAFQHTITGLCPNTYYEISCWMRNICSKCGSDSNGKNATNMTGPPYYIPTGPGDSSGVAPNLTFELNGIDYYTTGNLIYNGQWVKKGFTFLTGPLQTSFTLKFFNNAPGGGGNDWALDDISVSTCSPNMKYSPSVNPIVCAGNGITLYDTIRSFFNNYTYYKWQRSTDNGASWTDITGALGPSSPYWNGSAWEYVTPYNIPPAWTNLSDSGDLYRVIVATTLSNLSNPSCSFTESTNIISLKVIDCGIPLKVSLLSFTGILKDNRVTLNWTTTNEDESIKFDIEKIDNNAPLITVYTMEGFNPDSSDINSYAWTDPDILTGKAYYRLKIYNGTSKNFYSRIISFSLQKENFDLVSVLNPFKSSIEFEAYTDRNGKAEARLFDRSGKVVKVVSLGLVKGINSLRIDELSSLPPGVYLLRLFSDGEVLYRKLLKQ